MCGVGAMKLEAGIKEEDILFVSYQNQVKRIFAIMNKTHIYSSELLFSDLPGPILCVCGPQDACCGCDSSGNPLHQGQSVIRNISNPCE